METGATRGNSAQKDKDRELRALNRRKRIETSLKKNETNPQSRGRSQTPKGAPTGNSNSPSNLEQQSGKPRESSRKQVRKGSGAKTGHGSTATKSLGQAKREAERAELLARLDELDEKDDEENDDNDEQAIDNDDGAGAFGPDPKRARTDDAHRSKPKLVDLSLLSEDSRGLEFRTWRKEVEFWYDTNMEYYDERILTSAVLKAISTADKHWLLETLTTSELTVKALLDELALDKSTDEYVREREALAEFRKCKRNDGETLKAFIERYRRVYIKARAMKQNNEATDGADLIERANLPIAQKVDMLKTHKGHAIHSSVLSDILIIARAYETCDKQNNERGRGRGRDRSVKQNPRAFVSEKSSGKGSRARKNTPKFGTGSHARKPTPSHRSSTLCKLFANSGTCKFGNGCKFSHAVDVQRDSDKGKGKGLSTYGKGGSTGGEAYVGMGNGGAARVLPGDWPCPKCKVNNFASRTACFKCGAAKAS